MHSTNLGRLFDLFGRKVTVILLLAFLGSGSLYAQESSYKKINLPGYDNRQIQYGFIMSGHQSYYRLTYADTFATAAFDSVHSIIPTSNTGFTLGGVLNVRIAQFLDFRFLPQVAFYEHRVQYNYTGNAFPQVEELVESTVFELPLLVKYKSMRRNNARVYLVGGIRPAFEVGGKRNKRNKADGLKTENLNISADVGIGFDFYFAFFKWSPEIRYTHGLRNMLKPELNERSLGLQSIKINTFSIGMTFEGGKSN